MMLASLLHASLSFPGPVHLHPQIHFAPSVVSEHGGWHDIAGAFTHKGLHHIFQGQGWNHATSQDLVTWSVAPHGPRPIHETYKGMDSNTDPCSGFVTQDEDGTVCAGFRQCFSSHGINATGFQSWDVPLELRCALDDDLKRWAITPDYLFNVTFYRPVPYDPARPWREKDGYWYVLLSFDHCNATTKALPCESGGMLVMWRSPTLRGAHADWQYVGPVFTSNATVLAEGSLAKEFVTIDYIGRLAGDPSTAPLGTRVFLNNVGGNGGGVGCCSGTTSYFIVEQSHPGARLVETAPQGMVDWGAFRLRQPTDRRASQLSDGEWWRNLKTSQQSGKVQVLGAMNAPLAFAHKSSPTAHLDGTGTRGLSMARTLGASSADQVSEPGRRVLIGWVGPGDGWVFEGHGSAQSLPRDLSLAPDRSLRQAFVPELQALRLDEMHWSGWDAWQPIAAGLQAEVFASFPASCSASSARCGVSILGDGFVQTSIVLSSDLGLVVVDATRQGNSALRAGPLPAAATDEKGLSGSTPAWQVHIYVDHSIIEVIVSNTTALVVYAQPSKDASRIQLIGAPADASGAELRVWPLRAPGHVLR